MSDKQVTLQETEKKDFTLKEGDNPFEAKKEKAAKEDKVPYTKLYSFADRLDGLLIFLGCIGGIAQGVVLPSFSLIFGDLIDALNNPDPEHVRKEMLRISLIFIYIGLGAWLASFLQNACWMVSAERQGKRIREAYLKAILRQNIGWFDEISSGQLSSRISADTILIQDAIGEKVGSLLQYMSTFISGFVLGFVKGWKLTLVILAVTPLLAIAGGFMMKMLASLANSGQKAYALAGAVASETFSGIKTVASLTGELIEIDRYSKNLIHARKVGMKKGIVSGVGMGTTMFFIFGVYALAFWYGGQLVLDGEYTGGNVMSVFFAVIMGAFALGQASPSFEAIAKGTGAAFKMFATIERVSPIDPTSDDGFKPEEVKGDIVFKGVVFRYPTRQEVTVLNQLELKIKAGQKVALVGQSGCGKSSTIALIQRFYDPEAGNITLDDYKLSDLNIRWLRSQFGYVGQEPVLFAGTIAENISIGKPGASQEEIEEAAKAANAHKFIIKFPDGYNTFVGEKGAQLSGGQKQRIAIARAIIKNPKILLLDEATSALDNKSERVVQQALDNVMQNRTTIVIAHRLSTIRHVDRIFVIDKGQVIEKGNHDELIALGGTYTALVTAQGGGEKEKLSESLSASTKTLAKTPDEYIFSEEEPEEDEVKKDEQVDKKEEEEKTGCCGKKKKTEQEKKEEQVSIGRIYKMNAPEIPFMLLGSIGCIANGVSNPIFAIVFSEVLSLFFQGPAKLRADLNFWIGIFVAIAGSAFVANILQAFFFGLSGELLTQRLRSLSFKAIIRNEMGWFDFEKHSTGVLTARLASDASLVEGLSGVRLGLTLQNLAAIIAGLVIAFRAGWELTLVVLACAPLMGFANAMQMQVMKGFSGKSQALLADANSIASEAFSNVRTIAAFVQEERVFQRYTDKLANPQKLAIRSGFVSGLLAGLGNFCIFLAYFVSFWYGGTLIADGKRTFLEVIKVFMAIAMSAMAIGQASAFLPDSAKAKAAAAAIFELLDRKSEIDPLDETQGKKLDDVKGEIELNDVHFCYPTRPEAPVLVGMNLRVKPGDIVALVGQSGCGKSSIVGLLERFYNVQQGQIFVDGHDIKDFNIRWWRKQIGYVGQEPVLFAGTIAENIAFGREGKCSQEEIEEAAKAANAHKFITEFPDGYNTFVGEKGAQLSGGQKQRIAIARAIIKNPKILLLDEATSALDTESEKIVQEALDKVMQGRTTIVIAHRLSTIRHANMIYVIEAGQVHEQGTHDELMEDKGIYYRLVRAQNSK